MVQKTFVLASVKFKPTSLIYMYPWIVEDLLYMNMCKHSGLIAVAELFWQEVINCQVKYQGYDSGHVQ